MKCGDDMRWLRECLLINQVFVLVVVEAFQNTDSTGGGLLIEPNEALFFASKEVQTSSKTNNYMYLNEKANHASNYLNYRALYGLRYHPSKQANVKQSAESFVAVNLGNEEPKSDEIIGNGFMEKFELGNDISTSNNKITTEVSIAEHEADESKILENIFQNLSLSTAIGNDDDVTKDEEDGYNRQHIMKPTNRVENALTFLAQRLKKLIYLSSDESRPESKFSPHLSTFGRFLSLFSAIKFENFPCITGRRPLRQLSGTCYNELECLHLGGIPLDRCASGFGVCCVFRAGCSSFSHQNVTYFESPQYPLTTKVDLELCSLTLMIAPHVKQVLIEFTSFELLPPTEGNCNDDRFYVSGHARNFNVPVLCGIGNGQHSEWWKIDTI